MGKQPHRWPSRNIKVIGRLVMLWATGRRGDWTVEWWNRLDAGMSYSFFFSKPPTHTFWELPKEPISAVPVWVLEMSKIRNRTMGILRESWEHSASTYLSGHSSLKGSARHTYIPLKMRLLLSTILQNPKRRSTYAGSRALRVHVTKA